MTRRSRMITLAVGLLVCCGSPARAQLGDLGAAVQKGATDAGKQELMKQAGVPTPGTPAATPAAEGGAANAPAGGEKVAPAGDTGAPDAPSGD